MGSGALALREITEFKLNLTPGAMGSTIELDGKPLHNVRALRVECGVDHATKVFLEFAASKVDIVGAAKRRNVQMSEEPPARTFWTLHRQQARAAFCR